VVKAASTQVEPAKFTLSGKWAAQTLLATGRLAEGTLRDQIGRERNPVHDGGRSFEPVPVFRRAVAGD
jgi:hypothetical protein